MVEQFQQRSVHYLLLLGVGAALFLLNLGGATLWDVDEGRNCTAAQEMLASHNWIVPTFGDLLRVDKPALLYWLQAISYQGFGTNEFAARLPSALAALLTVLLCYELGRRLFSPGTGLLAGLVVASTPLFCAAARFANPDALLNCFTALTLFLFWRGYPRGGWFWFASLGTAMGLAVLAKGPVGLVLPLAVIVLFLLWNKELQLLLDRRFFLGVLMFCLVALPWYILVGIETKGQFLREFILNHNVDRVRFAKENHAGSLLYYPAVMMIGFAPWSFFFVLAAWYSAWSMVRAPHSSLRRFWLQAADHEDEAGAGAKQIPQQHRYRFLLCWIVVYLAAFSLAATKLPNYVLPIYVPSAIFLGRFFDRWLRGTVQPPTWLVHVSFVGIALAGVTLGAGLMIAGGMVPMDFMHDHYIHGLERWASMGVILLAGGILAVILFRRQRLQAAIVSLVSAIILFMVPLAAWASATLNGYKAPRPLVQQAGALQRDRDIRIGAWQLEHLPSLNFYCQRGVIHFKSRQQACEFLRYPIPVFLFLPESNWKSIANATHGVHVVARHRDMYHGCDVVVVTNQEPKR